MVLASQVISLIVLRQILTIDVRLINDGLAFLSDEYLINS
jgi:hypothetical protein